MQGRVELPLFLALAAGGEAGGVSTTITLAATLLLVAGIIVAAVATSQPAHIITSHKITIGVIAGGLKLVDAVIAGIGYIEIALGVHFNSESGPGGAGCRAGFQKLLVVHQGAKVIGFSASGTDIEGKDPTLVGDIDNILLTVDSGVNQVVGVYAGG